jgi:hypothetical protein
MIVKEKTINQEIYFIVIFTVKYKIVLFMLQHE